MMQTKIEFDTPVYIHRLTNERLEIIKMFGSVVSCSRIEKPKEFNRLRQKWAHPIAVCNVANLDVC